MTVIVDTVFVLLVAGVTALPTGQIAARTWFPGSGKPDPKPAPQPQPQPQPEEGK